MVDSVKEVVDSFKYGGVAGLIKMNGKTKSFACDYNSTLTKKQLRDHFKDMAIGLGISLGLKDTND